MVLQHRHFYKWKQAVISAIDKITSHLSTKLTTENSENTLKLKDKIIADKLKILYNKCVAILIITDSGNIDFVCQRLYTQDLIYELGLTNVNKITTAHMKTNKPIDKI